MASEIYQYKSDLYQYQDTLKMENNIATYWERIALLKWGSYVSGIEEQAILKAHNLAAKPSIALEVGCEGGDGLTCLPRWAGRWYAQMSSRL